MRNIIKAIVLPNDPLSIYVKQGNLEQFMDRFKYYADNLGEVYIYNRDDKEVHYSYPNITIINAKKSMKLMDFFGNINDLYRICGEKEISFLRTTEGGSFLKSAIIGIVAKMKGIPSVVSIHGTYRGLSETQKYKFYQKPVFRFLELITKLTASITFVIDKMYIKELHWKNMHLIPNYVDCEEFSPQKVAKRWDGVYVGALHARKGIPHLIESVKMVRKAFPKARFAVIGFGPDSSLLKDVEGIDYMGPVSHEKLPYYYNRSRMFVTATLHEGFAIPLVEAQACGIPIIATDLPPFYNNTIPGKTSLLSLATDSEKMSQNIINLIHDGNKRNAMGKAGRVFVKKNFNRNEILKHETELIKSVLRKVQSKIQS